MYSTDLADTQWNNIKGYLENKDRKRKISLRLVWNALINDRRLCRNYELLIESAEEMVKLSAIRILIKHF